MNWLDWLEKRYGRYAAPNVTLWLLAGQAMVFLAQYLGPNAAAGGGANAIFNSLSLFPQKVYEGQWWRLLTFPFLAPLNAFPLLVIFFFWFFWFLGTTLEGAWGTFRYNAYLAIGYVATVAAAFLAETISPGSGFGSADFLYGSLFLAFARLYPDFEIYAFLILPIKVKWLARLQWFFYWMTILLGDWHTRMMATAAIANYLAFFGRDVFREAKQGHRRMQHKAKTLKSSSASKVIHECRVCGLTNEMAPKTAFRYCSKCAGQACYCPEHLHDHECVVEESGQS